MKGLWLALLAGGALAQESPQGGSGGQRIGLVQLQAVDGTGGLPADDLLPLLTLEQGDVLDEEAVRTDILTLFRLGEFAAVEAHVDPLISFDAATGELITELQLTYLVQGAPKLVETHVQGPRHIRKLLQPALRPWEGEVFHPDHDTALLLADLQAELAEDGWREAKVDLSTTRAGARVRVDVVVQPGPRHVYDRIEFVGDLPVPERRLRMWARGHQVRPGAPASEANLRAAARDITGRLQQMGDKILSVHRGYNQATVVAAQRSTEAEGDTRPTRAVFTVSPGPRLTLDVKGKGFNGRGQVIRLLGLSQYTRLSERFLESAESRLLREEQRRGFLNAEVDVAAVPTPEGTELRVRVERDLPYRLGRMTFEGATAFSRRDLATVVIRSDEQLERRRLNRSALMNAPQALQDAYRAQGYPDASVMLADDFDAMLAAAVGNRGRFTPTFLINEGPQALLRRLTVSVEGDEQGVADHVAWATGELQELVGTPAVRAPVESVARLLEADLERDGWLDARVTVRTRLDRTGAFPVGEADMTIVTGDRVRLRALVVDGLRHTQRRVVMDNLGLQRGEPISPDALDQARARLYGLGIFSSVTWEILGDGPARDVIFSLTERKRWTFEFGGGLNTDQGIRLYNRIARRNLWGLGHRLDLQGQVGLDWFSDPEAPSWALNTALPEWRLSAAYKAKDFPFPGHAWTLYALLRERQQERAWALDKAGLSLQWEIPVAPTIVLIPTVGWDLRSLVRSDEGALIDGEPWELLEQADLGPCSFIFPDGCRPQETVGLRLVMDRRNDPIVPTGGFVLSTGATWSPGIGLNGADSRPQAQFLKAQASFTWYQPVGRTLLRFTGEGGVGWSYGGTLVPLEDRFRMGGTGSIRGYRRDAVGPQHANSQGTPEEPNYVATGGDSYGRLVTEWSIPLNLLGLKTLDDWAWAFFADGGNAWHTFIDDPDEVDPFGLPVLVGIGTGLRIATPVGPVQFDIATPTALWSRSVRRGDFTFTGQKVAPVTVHLTIGNLW